MNASHLLSVSVTPVVLISACGLITLALYNRLGAILARVRAFHQQKIELLKNCHEHEAVEQQMLMDMLDSQIVAVTVKARAIQKGLYSLLAAIAAFLLCSLFAGATELHEWVGMISLGMGFFGVFLFIVGLGWAIWELKLSLTPLEEESAYLKVLTALHLAKTQGENMVGYRSALSGPTSKPRSISPSDCCLASSSRRHRSQIIRPPPSNECVSHAGLK